MLQSILNEAHGINENINRSTSLSEDLLEAFTLSEEINHTALVIEMSQLLVHQGQLSEEDATAKSKTLWEKFKAKVKLWWNKVKNFFAKIINAIKNRITKLTAFLKNLVVDTVEAEVVDIADYQWAVKTSLRIQKYFLNKTIDTEGLTEEIHSFNEKWGDILMNVKSIKLNKGQIAKYETLLKFIIDASNKTNEGTAALIALKNDKIKEGHVMGKALQSFFMCTSKIATRLTVDLRKVNDAKTGLGKDK